MFGTFLREEEMAYRVESIKRTPKGVYVSFEEVDGDGWLKVYVDEKTADSYRFDKTYQLTIEEV